MTFKRGISNEFLNALETLAKGQNWWRDVLEDASLIIAIRDEYLNVYWYGQSIFRVACKGGKVQVSTHEKYLLNPDLSGQISLIDGTFDFSKAADRMLTHKYDGSTLTRLKKAAALYSGLEKKGVHQIAMANPTVIDVEIAINAAGIANMTRALPRMDIASMEPADTGVDLVFWEAKTFNNPELENYKVVDQAKDYQTIINAYLHDIADSYFTVAKNMTAIAGMSNGKRGLAPTIKAVADGAKLNVRSTNIGLLVYDFTKEQRDRTDKTTGLTLLQSLQAEFADRHIGTKHFRFRGKARDIAL